MMIDKINKDNKKVLKNADSIVFKLNEDGQSSIICIKKLNIDGYKTESRKEIFVNTSKSCGEKFENDNSYANYEIVSGSVVEMFIQESLEWKTIVSNLKTDDEIILDWYAGNNSNLINENNLSVDRLSLIIKRQEKKVLKFHINTSIDYKNSIARNIKIRKITF